MNRRPLEHGATRVALLVAGVLALAGAVAAQDLASERLATVSVSSAGVDFRPEIDHGGAILTVKGGSVGFRQEFAAGEWPSVGVFDPAGEPLSDGLYQWELELLPTPEARSNLMVETTENGGETPSANAPLSGAFTVVDGFIADPELEEPGKQGSGGPADSGFLASDPAFLAGPASADRTGDDTDEASALCEGRRSLRSASCEADVQAALASQETRVTDPFAAGLVAPDRMGLGDSDADVAAGGLAAAEVAFTSADEAIETPARRFVDPEGADGRPRTEEELSDQQR